MQFFSETLSFLILFSLLSTSLVTGQSNSNSNLSGQQSSQSQSRASGSTSEGIGASQSQSFTSTSDVEPNNAVTATIEGTVIVPAGANRDDFFANARVQLDGGLYLGFLRTDGTFRIERVASGASYILEVVHPSFAFETVRIDVSSKGKLRSRRPNSLKPGEVKTVPYPIRLQAVGRVQYFAQREQFRLTDLIFSPMVLMMLVPVLIIFIMPKLLAAQDPEAQKEMAEMNANLMNPSRNMPDLGEWVSGLFGGGGGQSSSASGSSGSGSGAGAVSRSGRAARRRA